MVSEEEFIFSKESEQIVKGINRIRYLCTKKEQTSKRFQAKIQQLVTALNPQGAFTAPKPPHEPSCSKETFTRGVNTFLKDTYGCSRTFFTRHVHRRPRIPLKREEYEQLNITNIDKQQSTEGSYSAAKKLSEPKSKVKCAILQEKYLNYISMRQDRVRLETARANNQRENIERNRQQRLKIQAGEVFSRNKYNQFIENKVKVARDNKSKSPQFSETKVLRTLLSHENNQIEQYQQSLLLEDHVRKVLEGKCSDGVQK